MTLQTIIPYVAPPVVGAVIGYVTNDIAIRMLFRPLRPWHVLGLRVPLTPGVIPAGRHEFAAKIGRMVGTHLVTGDDVARALGKDAFRRELREAVGDRLDRLLDTDLGTVESLVPEGLERWLRDLTDTVRRRVTDEILGYLEGDRFREELGAYLRSLEERFLPRELESLLSGERYEALRGNAERLVGSLCQSRGVARTVVALVDEKFEEFIASERSLRELLPAEVTELVAAQLEQEISPLLGRLGEFLHEPETLALLEEKLREGASRSLASMHGMLGFLANFVSVEKLSFLFPGLASTLADELARWLKEEETRRRVARIGREELDLLLDRPLASWIEKLPYERVAPLRRFARRAALGILRSPETARLLVSLAEREVQRFVNASTRPLLESIVPAEEAERLRGTLVEWVVALLRAPDTRQTVERMVSAKLDEWLFRQPIGRLSARIPADVRRDLETVAFRQVTELLQKEVPPLIEAVDVSRMVEEKVNGLDILKVERLLLDIMEKHFIYINLFGALLGFLMGFVNVALSNFF